FARTDSICSAFMTPRCTRISPMRFATIGDTTVMTSNKGFEEWGDVLGDEVMAAALIDRVLHHCHIVNIRGNSYRMRQHTELWRTLHQDAEETNRSRRKTKEAKPA